MGRSGTFNVSNVLAIERTCLWFLSLYGFPHGEYSWLNSAFIKILDRYDFKIKCILLFFVILQHYTILVCERIFFLGKEKFYNLKLYYPVFKTEFF